MSYGNSSSLPPSLQAQMQSANNRSIAGTANQPLIGQSNSSLYHQQYAGYPGVPHPGLHQSPYGALDPNQSPYGPSSLNAPQPSTQNKNAPTGYPPGYPPGLGLPPGAGLSLPPGGNASAVQRRPSNQLPSHYQTAAALNSSLQSGGRTAPGSMPNYNQNHSLGAPGNPYAAASPYHHSSPYGGQMPTPNDLWPGQLHQNRLPYPGGYNSTSGLASNSNSTQNSSPYGLHSGAGYYGSSSGMPGLPQPNNNATSALSSDNSLIANSSSAFNQSPYGRYGQQPQQPPPPQQQQTGSAGTSTSLPPGYHSGYDSQTRLSQQQQQPYSSSSSSAYASGYGKYSGGHFSTLEPSIE